MDLCRLEVRQVFIPNGSSLTNVTLGVSVPQKTAIIGMAGISVFALMYLLSGVFWWAFFSSGILISIHAFLRDASMHKDMDDAMAMEGDLHIGEESSFLGTNPV